MSTRCRNHGPNGSCIECIEREDKRKLRLKLQDTPRCVQAVVDYQAANAFQSYLQEHRFRIQRCGFLYGKYNDDGSSSVEVIYEPPQRCEKDQIVLLQDVDEDRVEKIASLLGFTRVEPSVIPNSSVLFSNTAVGRVDFLTSSTRVCHVISRDTKGGRVSDKIWRAICHINSLRYVQRAY